MERLVAGIVEYGDMYRVQFVTGHDEKYIRTDNLYVNISNVAFDHIQKALENGTFVFIPKGLVGKNEISFADLIYDEPDELLRRKSVEIVKERRKFDNELGLLSALTVANFVMINNEFANEGIFITNDNRDEVYLDIVSGGDDAKIKKLSRYLDCMDDINRVDFVRRRYNQFEDKVTNATSIEGLESFLDIYHSSEK